MNSTLTLQGRSFPTTYRETPDVEAQPASGGFPSVVYAQMVGGASAHFTANYWRMVADRLQ